MTPMASLGDKVFNNGPSEISERVFKKSKCYGDLN